MDKFQNDIFDIYRSVSIIRKYMKSSDFLYLFTPRRLWFRGSDNAVGIATGYGLDGPGIESQWGRDFPPSRPALEPTQPPVQWVLGLSRGKERPGRDADPNPFLVPWPRKSRVIPLIPLWSVRPVQSLSACTKVHFTFIFTFYDCMLLNISHTTY